jgi:hypothetical protein
MKEEDKERKGYRWVETTSGGYWSKMTGQRHSFKKPLFCPYEECRRPTGTYDDKFLQEFGLCGLCYTMYVESREKPLLDVEFYRNRLKQRGY